jgi:hypothetical protein
VTDDFERLDRVLAQLVRVLDAPGVDAAGSPEQIWQKMDLFYESMGADALRALLRRQGMGSSDIEDALNVLEQRRSAMS